MENVVLWLMNYGVYLISGLGLLLALFIRFIGPEKFWTNVAIFLKIKVISKGKIVRNYGDAEENERYAQARERYAQNEYDASCGIISKDSKEFIDMNTNVDTSVELECIDAVQTNIAEFKNVLDYNEWLKKISNDNAMCFTYDEETQLFFDVALAEGEEYDRLRNHFLTEVIDSNSMDINNLKYDCIIFTLNREIASLTEVENVVNHFALQDLNDNLANVVVVYTFLCDHGTELYLHRLMEKTNG